MAAGKKKLAANVYVDGVLHKKGSTPDKDVADQITNPKAWDADADTDAATDPAGSTPATPADYDGLTVPKLKAEIKARNEGRDDDAKLSADGDKAALIETLRADDAKTANA